MAKWMVIDKVYYYTLDSIYRRQQPDRAGPIHEFRKGSLFSGQLPPPQKLVPGRFGPGSGDTEVGVQRQREGVIIIIINIPSLVHDVADCSLERSQLASSICQKFHLHSRIDGSTTLPLPSILFSRKDGAPPWYDSICSIGDVIWRLLPTLHLHLFYAEDKNLQVGEFSFMVKSRKQIYEFVFIGSLFLHSKSQCWANAGRWNSRFHECMV